MEITYSEQEVKNIILEHAKKIFPEANYVVGDYHSRIPSVTVSFLAPIAEPQKKDNKVYIAPEAKIVSLVEA